MEKNKMHESKFDGNFQVLLKEELEWNILTIIGKIKIL